ncbi:MAG TPA: Gfo/Idh/MocA family oxidoreductase, partial [Microlunatus sp.]
MSVIRIGLLGAARIAPFAVINPARRHPDVEVTAVAARELSRAQRFAARHAIPRAYGSYADLLTDPAIDAVYIGLPNALHGRWIAAAVAAGKHVLCEKPLTANADEAGSVAELVAARPDLVVMEAFHYRYHPLMERLLKIIESGELGRIERLAASFCFPVPPPGNIRWSYELAGGALMDAGVYPIHLLRTLTGAEPEVVAAEARTRRPGVDRLFRADLLFPGGTPAH